MDFYHAPSPVDGSPHVFVATPAITIHANYVAAIARALPMVMAAGVAIDHFLLHGCTHVDDARNICVGKFLATKCDALIFIDADVGFPWEALLRLARHEGDVVAGVYPKKGTPRSWPVKFEEGTEPPIGPDGLIREGVAGLPTGFMRIARRVLEKAAEERLDRSFRGVDGERFAPIIFERDYERGERISGDFAFCRWARAAGFQLALDPFIPFTHAGEMLFGGRLADEFAAPDQENAA